MNPKKDYYSALDVSIDVRPPTLLPLPVAAPRSAAAAAARAVPSSALRP